MVKHLRVHVCVYRCVGPWPFVKSPGLKPHPSKIAPKVVVCLKLNTFIITCTISKT